MSTINKTVIPPPPDAECPACGSPATPRYTLLSGLEVCYLCPDCGLEFNMLNHGRGRQAAAIPADGKRGQR